MPRPARRRRPGAPSSSDAFRHAAEHLSLYQLTIEPGTLFERLHEAGKLDACPTRSAARALYELTQEICEAHGLPAYEISNHARPGAESRHNLVYWRYGEYAGVGPGAHGRLVTGERALAHRDREASGDLARPGRDARATASSTRSALTAEDAGRRVPADGSAPARRHRSRSDTRLSPGGSWTRPGSASSKATVSSRAARTPASP